MATRVLLIDDDSRMYELLAQYLGQNGITVTHAPDGGRGLAALDEKVEKPVAHHSVADDDKPGFSCALHALTLLLPLFPNGQGRVKRR